MYERLRAREPTPGVQLARAELAVHVADAVTKARGSAVTKPASGRMDEGKVEGRI